MEPGIHIEDRPGGLRLLTVSNPRKRNALDPALLAQLEQALEPRAAEGLRVLLVRGDGEHFCSGYDLAGLESIPEQGPLPDDPLQRALVALEAFPVPTVACVRGGAFGAGAELAASCDLRVFASDAVFCLPPAKIGVVYAPEGISKLIELVGAARAKRLFFTGMRVGAEEALGWGLCDLVRPPAETEAAALALCQEIADAAPLAVRGMKRVFRALLHRELPAAEAEALRAIRRQAFRSEDVREGRAAFLEKRAPRFNGR